MAEVSSRATVPTGVDRVLVSVSRADVPDGESVTIEATTPDGMTSVVATVSGGARTRYDGRAITNAGVGFGSDKGVDLPAGELATQIDGKQAARTPTLTTSTTTTRTKA